MPSLVIAMISAAAFIALVLLSWAAYDNGEERRRLESREPEEPGELEPARIAA
jgi:hypothetical protein